jgi:hypothetical protein
VRALNVQYDEALELATRSLPARFRWVDSPSRPFVSRYFYADRVTLPNAGWKIHISTSLRYAAALFERVVPHLIDHSLNFKLPASATGLRALNSGVGGLPQIGKVVTIYPPNETSFRHHALWFDQHWRPIRFPNVRSDFQISEGGAVFFRYGDFFSSSLGAHPAHADEVDLAPNVRRLRPVAPARAKLPLPHVEVREQVRTISIGGTEYIRIKPVRQSAKGDIELGITPSLDTTFIKIAHVGADEDFFGFDSSDRLQREVGFLIKAKTAGVSCPAVLDFSIDPEPAVALQDIRGMRPHWSRSWGTEMISAIIDQIQRLHVVGILHRDVKPSNIIIDNDGKVVLIDFEHACYVGESPAPVCSSGVFTAPDARRTLPCASHDVYSLGVTCVELLSRREVADYAEIGNALTILDRSKYAHFAKLLRAATSPSSGARCNIDDLRAACRSTMS